MKTLAKNKATAPLADYVDDLKDETVIVTSKGRPVAALVSLRNVDAETISLSSNPDFIRIIERSRNRQKLQGGYSPSEVRRKLGLSRARSPRRRRASPQD